MFKTVGRSIFAALFCSLAALGLVACEAEPRSCDSLDDTDPVQVVVDRGLDLLAYLARNDSVGWYHYDAIFDDNGESRIAFDIVSSTVSSHIPSYYVNDLGMLNVLSIAHSPLFVGDELVGFLMVDTSKNGVWVSLMGVTEEGASQVADFLKEQGSVSLVVDRDGIWMVSGGVKEKLSVDYAKWFVPVGVMVGFGGLETVAGEGERLGCIDDADLLAVESTDLSYRYSANYIIGEKIVA